MLCVKWTLGWSSVSGCHDGWCNRVKLVLRTSQPGDHITSMHITRADTTFSSSRQSWNLATWWMMCPDMPPVDEKVNGVNAARSTPSTHCQIVPFGWNTLTSKNATCPTHQTLMPWCPSLSSWSRLAVSRSRSSPISRHWWKWNWPVIMTFFSS